MASVATTDSKHADDAAAAGKEEEDVMPDMANMQLQEEPDARLNLALVRKAAASAGESQASVDDIMSTKRLRLDWQRIRVIENLEMFTHVSELYLQSNRIEKIENLECVPNLRWLVLSNNRISKVEGIDHLKKLEILDLSENRIAKVAISSIPQGIKVLKLLANPCCADELYRLQFMVNFPDLVMFDGEKVEHEEHKLLRTVLGYEAAIESDDEELDEGDEGGTGEAAGDSKTGEHKVDPSSAVAALSRELQGTAAQYESLAAELDAHDAAYDQKMKDLKAKYRKKLQAQRAEFTRESVAMMKQAASTVESAREELAVARQAAVERSKKRQAEDEAEFTARQRELAGEA